MAVTCDVAAGSAVERADLHGWGVLLSGSASGLGGAVAGRLARTHPPLASLPESLGRALRNDPAIKDAFAYMTGRNFLIDGGQTPW